jgi:hypothetical protein
MEPQKDAKEMNVRVITIDDFVKENNFPRVDFIKIDTEGYEAQILKGAKETIKKFKPTMVMAAYHNRSDKELLPEIVKSIDSSYKHKLIKHFEEDLIFYVQNDESEN